MPNIEDLGLNHDMENLNSLNNDLDEVLTVEVALRSTDDVEEQIKLLNGIGFPEELTVESAVAGGGFFKKLKDIKNNITGAGSSQVEKVIKKMEGKESEIIKELESMKKKISNSSTVKEMEPSLVKALNNKLGLFSSMGYKFNVKDLVEFSKLPVEFNKNLVTEVVVLGKEIGGGKMETVTKGKFSEAIKNGLFKPGKESTKFVKSLKDVDFKKDEQIFLGFPASVYSKELKLVTLRWSEEKSKVLLDHDVIDVKGQNIKPFSTKECLVLIDSAIEAVKNQNKLNKAIQANIKTALPDFLKEIEDAGEFIFSEAVRQSGGSSASSFINKMNILVGNLWTFNQNISYAAFNYVNLVKNIVKGSVIEGEITTEGFLDIFKTKLEITPSSLDFLVFYGDLEFAQKGFYYLSEKNPNIKIHEEDVNELIGHIDNYLKVKDKSMIIDRNYSGKLQGNSEEWVTSFNRDAINIVKGGVDKYFAYDLIALEAGFKTYTSKEDLDLISKIKNKIEEAIEKLERDTKIVKGKVTVENAE